MKSKIKDKVYSEISEGSVFYREGLSEQVLENPSPKLQPLKKEKKKEGPNWNFRRIICIHT